MRPARQNKKRRLRVCLQLHLRRRNFLTWKAASTNPSKNESRYWKTPSTPSTCRLKRSRSKSRACSRSSTKKSKPRSRKSTCYTHVGRNWKRKPDRNHAPTRDAPLAVAFPSPDDAVLLEDPPHPPVFPSDGKRVGQSSVLVDAI